MKKIKLMALGLMVMMIQSVGAVTLPSTSYSPYSSGIVSGSESGVVFSSGSVVTGSYQALGENSNDISSCQGYDKGTPERSSCCNDIVKQCYKDCQDETDPYSCMDDCDTENKKCIDAPSLPLDGGLSIMLVLALGSGAVKVFKRKK